MREVALALYACISLSRGLRHLHEDCNFFKPTVISVVPSIAAFLVAKKALNPELCVILVGAAVRKKK